MSTPTADTTVLDRALAARWYQEGWLRAWNEDRPELCHEILTDDFVLDTPTTRHTGSSVRGPAAVADYIRYVKNAYPDLIWEETAPPLFADDLARVAYSWRGTGHFSGRFDPPGIEGNGRPFAFSGLEVFDFRGDRACRLDASYDLLGLMKQIGLYRRADRP